MGCINSQKMFSGFNLKKKKKAKVVQIHRSSKIETFLKKTHRKWQLRKGIFPPRESDTTLDKCRLPPLGLLSSLTLKNKVQQSSSFVGGCEQKANYLLSLCFFSGAVHFPQGNTVCQHLKTSAKCVVF